MKRQTGSPARISEKIGLYVVGILSAAIAFFLSAVSMLHTTVVEPIGADEAVNNSIYHIHEQIESVFYSHDSLLLNLIMLAAYILILFVFVTRIKRIPFRRLKLGLFLWTFLIGTVWVVSSQTCPSHDSLSVTSAALDFAQNDFTKLSGDNYFKFYPFQLGYVFLCEMLIRFFSKFGTLQTLMPLEIVNALFLAVINLFLLMLGNQIFKDERVNLVTAVLLALSAAPVISCAFLYGIFPGMAFAVIALYCEIRYLKENKILFAVFAALSIAAAVMLKSNYLIWLIAMVLIALVKLPGRKKYAVDAVFLAAAVVLSVSIQPIIQSSYEKRSGITLGDSIPYISWIAMGLSESDLAPGWYNILITVTNFEDSQFQSDTAAERSANQVKERLKFFLKNPQYTNDFFYLKITSQWNETSYQSIWNNVIRSQYKEKGPLAEWVCVKGKKAVKKGMDFFAQLIFFGFFAGCVYMLKRKQFLMTPLPVIFLGGFFYQLISEGKSQYILPYFMVMTAFAAFGLVCLLDSLTAYAEDHKRAAKLLAFIDPEATSPLQKADKASRKAMKAAQKAKDAAAEAEIAAQEAERAVLEAQTAIQDAEAALNDVRDTAKSVKELAAETKEAAKTANASSAKAQNTAREMQDNSKKPREEDEHVKR